MKCIYRYHTNGQFARVQRILRTIENELKLGIRVCREGEQWAFYVNKDTNQDHEIEQVISSLISLFGKE
jgi:hypothetical protein